MDYQIWCGPSMGSFNDWTNHTYLEMVENRKIVDVTRHIFQGAAYLFRVQSLKMQSIRLPLELEQYYPEKPLAD